jgi:hypothetical protein
VAVCAPLFAQTDRCEQFTALVRKTYDFVPVEIPDERRKALFAAMDEVWNMAKSAPAVFTPCLRGLLEAPDAQAWFRCDGSSLLVELDPSRASLELKARLWSHTSIEIVDLEPWTWTIATLGAQDLDVSAAGEAWLRERTKTFTVAQHALTVGSLAGALFAFGSMDEALSEPVLVRIAADASHPGRGDAVQILAMLATAPALADLRALDLAWMPARDREGIQVVCGTDAILKPRASGPARKKIVDALQAFVDGDPEDLHTLQVEREHWYEELVHALREEDLPLLRRVRRLRLAALSDEALTDYVQYGNVLWATLPERSKRK